MHNYKEVERIVFIIQLIGSRYACIFTDGIIIESPISQASIDEERRCITLLIIFVHIIAPVISGCAVAYYTYWLSKRNK
ncbi:type I toxin-antitoxin system Fst family toxin (plasmid) [Staphylococcus aureus]|nr:type I toxin-antitoxin system Fst family toxin [Staphylococcus aureus]WIZ55863.1 type I toxin-antitoxin system Fst family toxin [Staphylococcus aureus]WJB14084.1 type I toxin-antitoxin system Fst family toxin [Staphylococcus aureus]WJB50718.1 type I toxin-antitoxin system Fst family toxin [Staphylococcus aureus]WJD16747.1 type I toxin-antitoxin system Fst family toxin [Staphylococcus aureus]